MAKFRLKIDMSTFFNDERKLVYVLVDPKWKHVRSLQSHVQEIFNVQNLWFITQDECFIPPQESIDIIKTSDVLRAIIPSDEIKEKKQKKLKCDEINENLGKKRKYRKTEEDFVSSTPNNLCEEKKSRLCSIISDPVTVIEIAKNTFVSNVIDGNDSDLHTKKTKCKSNNCLSSKSIDDEKSGHESVNGEITPKRKRKRCRKKKTILDNTSISKSPEVILTKKSRKKKIVKSSDEQNSQLKNGHLFFDEDGTTMNGTPKKIISPSTSTFKCALDEIAQDKRRIFKIERESKEEPSHKKMEIEIIENIVLKPNDIDIPLNEKVNESSVIEIPSFDTDETEIIEVNNTEDGVNLSEIPLQSDAKVESNNLLNATDLPIPEIFPLTEPLVGLPKIGDIILFKMYCLDSSTCTPSISDLITGKCENIYADNTVKCLIIAGTEEIENIPSKFKMPEDNISSSLKYLHLNLTDMIEARIFKMS